MITLMITTSDPGDLFFIAVPEDQEAAFIKMVKEVWHWNTQEEPTIERVEGVVTLERFLVDLPHILGAPDPDLIKDIQEQMAGEGFPQPT